MRFSVEADCPKDHLKMFLKLLICEKCARVMKGKHDDRPR